MSTFPTNSIIMEEFVEIIRQYNIIPTIIMDLGSMDGSDAIYLKQCFSSATVYAVEGLPSNFDVFKNNQTIIPLNNVVCSYNGKITYYVKDINGIHGIYNRGDRYGNKQLILPCVTFKTLLETNNIDHIDVLKLDVEGASYDVLASLGERIESITIMHIETETKEFFKNQQLEPKVFDLLSSKGFIKIKQTSAAIDRNGFQSDSVWLNKRMIEEN